MKFWTDQLACASRFGVRAREGQLSRGSKCEKCGNRAPKRPPGPSNSHFFPAVYNYSFGRTSWHVHPVLGCGPGKVKYAEAQNARNVEIEPRKGPLDWSHWLTFVGGPLSEVYNVLLGLVDYSQVDMLGPRYKTVKFGTRTRRCSRDTYHV